jgi:hypothetical protein
VNYRTFCALAFVFLTACANEAQTGSSKSAVATLPIQRDSKHVSILIPKNLITDSNTLRSWLLAEGFVRGTTAKGGPVDAELPGTGSPTGAYMYSGPISVLGGKRYALSIWADPSGFIKSDPILTVVNGSRNDAIYGPQFQLNGPAGRFTGTVSIPPGVTQVRLGIFSGGGTIATGRKFTVRQPIFGEYVVVAKPRRR